MYKNSALLSISAALLLSLFFLTGCQHDFGLDIKFVDKGNDGTVTEVGMSGTANLATTPVSSTPNPCTEGGKRRTGAPSKKRCPLESGEKATGRSPNTNTVMNASVKGLR